MLLRRRVSCTLPPRRGAGRGEVEKGAREVEKGARAIGGKNPPLQHSVLPTYDEGDDSAGVDDGKNRRSIELLSTQESRGRNFITPGISSHHTTCVPILLYCIHFLRRKGSIRTILLELIRPCEHLNCFLHVKSRRYSRNLP